MSRRTPRCAKRGESRTWVPFTTNWKNVSPLFCNKTWSRQLINNHLGATSVLQVHKLTKALKSSANERHKKVKKAIFLNCSIFHLSCQCFIIFQNMRLPKTKPYLKTPHTEKAMILALLGSSGELILISSVWIFGNVWSPHVILQKIRKIPLLPM